MCQCLHERCKDPRGISGAAMSVNRVTDRMRLCSTLKEIINVKKKKILKPSIKRQNITHDVTSSYISR